MSHSLRNSLFALVLLLLSSACASSKGAINLRDFKAAPEAPSSERIGPGDLLALRVWNAEQMTSRQRVRPDGTVVMFFMDSLPVAGKTPTEVSADIARRLDGVFVAPRVSVVIEESAASTVTLLGEVRRPGTYGITRPLSVIEALALGGGLTEFARTSRIFVLRDATPRVRIRVRYEELLRGDDRSRGLVVRAGDAVIVE